MVVLTVSVKLIQVLHLPTGQCAVVQVKLDGGKNGRPLLLESNHSIDQELVPELSDMLLQPTEGTAQKVAANTSGFTQRVPQGTTIGQAVPSSIVDFPELPSTMKCERASASPRLLLCEIMQVDDGLDSAAMGWKVLEAMVKFEQLNVIQTGSS